jgi:NitT/TauT family transport system substrate-binding protein
MKRLKIIAIIGPICVVVLAIAFLRRIDSPPSTTATTTSLTVLLDWKITPPYAAYILADANGYYRSEGLSVNFVEGQGAETSAKLIGQGQYYIGTCNAAATAIAVDNNIPIESVAMVEQDAVTAIFSLKKTNITKPADLLGKTLGVRYFDISHQEYLAMMRASGLDPTKVKEVNVGFDLQPLLTGQVDALYNYAYNMPVQLEQMGYDINVILVKDEGVNGYGSNIIVNDKYAREHPDVVTKFLRASERGWEAELADPASAMAALAKRYPELNSPISLAIIKAQLPWVFPTQLQKTAPALFEQSADRWRMVLQTYRDLGLIKHSIDPAQVFSNEYLP